MEKYVIIKEYREFAENLMFSENREKWNQGNIIKQAQNLCIDASVDQFWKELNIFKSFVIFRSLLKSVLPFVK